MGKKQETCIEIKCGSKQEAEKLRNFFLTVIPLDTAVKEEDIENGYKFIFETRKNAKSTFNKVVKKLKESHECKVDRNKIVWELSYEDAVSVVLDLTPEYFTEEDIEKWATDF